MTGFAEYKGEPVLVVGHVKGTDTKEKIFRNFGYARPEGYRKAMRAMRLAEKFGRPIFVFVDTPAAYPGIDSEERGVAEAIAVNLRDMASIDEARFLHSVRFEEGTLAAYAAAAKYDTAKGTLELSGTEPGQLTPRTVNERIAVDATRIDIVLEGPQVKAAGAVKSTLQPAKPGADSGDAKLPSMLKQDQPVTVVADNLAYDGAASIATYTGGAKLFQVDTTIKGDAMTLDEKKGDLSATGHTMTSTLREQEGKDKKKERVPSTGTSNELKYEDALRRMTYTGAAHLVGPEGDMSASKIELYLKESGDDVERAEGYTAPGEKLTLREVNRTTTGARMPVAPGRNIAILVEVAARNQLLRARGHHAARELAQRLEDTLRQGVLPVGADDTDEEIEPGGDR